jgi:photosystem II stability/assembly factor-like uncharacterized protein
MIQAQGQKIFFMLITCSYLLLFLYNGLCFGQSTWKLVDSLPQNNPLYSVTYGDSQFVAVGGGGTVLTSTDAVTWTIQNSGTTHGFTSVAYGNEQYVAVGQFVSAWSFGMIFTSTDGISWIDRALPQAGFYDCHFKTVIFDKDRFVSALGMSDIPSGSVWTSYDGIQWTTNCSTMSSYYASIVHSDSQYVVVGSEGGIFSSTDLSNCIKRSCPVLADLNSVAHGDSQFVIAGNGGVILSSTDAINWTKQIQV